jgi:hypothetical protein
MTGSARWATAHLRLGVAALALVACTFAARPAEAGDGAQFSTDCTRTYVNKKVGDNEQWAITWELFADATGNVLKLDGSPPSFIECSWQDQTDTEVVFDCRGASACSGPPCDGATEWTTIATGLRIPVSFFVPSGVDPVDPDLDCLPADE